MIAHAGCMHEEFKKHGTDRKGNQRYRCKSCGKTWITEVPKPLGDMRIEMDRAILCLKMLVDGMSVRACERIANVHRDTICDLVLTVGENCQRLLDSYVQGIRPTSVEMDEIWSFVYCKQKHATKMSYGAEVGDSWTFIAIDRDSKMVLSHQVGQRDDETAVKFLRKLVKATEGRFQITSDGLAAYQNNVPFEFQGNVDFAQLVKQYRSSQADTRYSPAAIVGIQKVVRYGSPDPEMICTSHIERLNKTLRMRLRRFTRLTDGHSKSLRHHAAMQALLFAHYNFVRPHSTVKTTPAVASGLVASAWSIEELLAEAAVSNDHTKNDH